MTRSLTEPEQIAALARRHIEVCETVFTTAIARADTETASHAARSALSVALGCAINLGTIPERETAILWYRRLSKLYADNTPALDYLVRTLRWASDAMSYVFGAGQGDIHHTKNKVANASRHAPNK